MSEMVERVAAAIVANLNGADLNWADIAARAAIAAMREPTEAMCRAGERDGDGRDGDGYGCVGFLETALIWEAMIDKALE